MTQRVNNLSAPRKFAVRLALASGATLATLLGAQSLALRENSNPLSTTNNIAAVGSTQTPEQPTLTTLVASATASPSLTNTAIKPTTMPPAAPNIVVIRNPGDVPTAIPTTPAPKTSTSAGAASQPGSGVAPIKPPQAVVAPGPVVVRPAPNQPAPSTNSSR